MVKQLRYLEIAQALKDRIITGKLQNGNMLPSQQKLSKVFSTSVMTIRQALSVLEEEGLISVIHGTGTFVSAQRMHSENIALQGFQNEMDSMSMRIENKIVNREYGITSSRLNHVFNDDDSSFSVLTRLRMVENRPVILQRSYIPDRYRDIIRGYGQEASLYRAVSEGAGLMLAKGREVLLPAVLNEPESGLLELNQGEPAFISRRVSLSLDGRVIIFDEAFLPGSNVFIASARHGRSNKFKYIIRQNMVNSELEDFTDSGLWEDLE